MRDWAFYFITDENLTRRGIVKDVEGAIAGGAKVIQYRNKTGETLDLYREAKELRRLTVEAGVDLIINDRLDIALAVGADGVHVGQSDMPLREARRLMPDGIIGVSIGSIQELEDALEGGATYVAVSPVWATPTKEDAGPGLGPEFISEVRSRTDVHVTTIGGIKRENLDEVLANGGDSVCAISATVGTDDVVGAVAWFEDAVRQGRKRI